MILLYEKIKNRILSLFPPDKNWKYQKQTDPPTFGWAKLVSNDILNKEVAKRKGHCVDIIKNSEKYCNFKKGKVSIVVLSCKRWHTLEKLILTAKPFFREIETYTDLEIILVDNGSGKEMIEQVAKYNFFDKIIAHENNLGMIGALKDIYSKVDGEYILYFEDDFYIDYDKPFINKCINLFNEYPEIGIIRLKNQNNWWKPARRISPIRITSDGSEFWTWLPSKEGNGNGNVWCAGSVIFRKVSYFAAGEIPDAPQADRNKSAANHATLYESGYGKVYNKLWLAAKIKDCCPFVQPNDNEESSGWRVNKN